jgi:hypothetical protein
MDRNTIVVIVGAVLAIAGIALVVLQMLRKGRQPAKRSASAKIGPVQFSLATTFPGLLVIALGVILLIVGLLTGR